MISDISKKEVPAFLFLCRQGEVLFPDIPHQGGAWMAELSQFVHSQNISIESAPIWIYEHLGGGRMHLKVGWPISPEGRDLLKPHPVFSVEEIPAFSCLTTQYCGSMVGIVNAWNDFVDALETTPFKTKNIHREVYLNWIEYNSAENLTELQIALFDGKT